MKARSRFRTCDLCGAALDPGEICDCKAGQATRTYEGKEVFTQDTFSYSAAKVGDYVERAVVEEAMDCLPPACMTNRCSQMGEPHSYREDPDTKEWKPTYHTFMRVTPGPDGIWQYCGCCFCGETLERGKDPVHC